VPLKSPILSAPDALAKAGAIDIDHSALSVHNKTLETNDRLDDYIHHSPDRAKAGL
jgi:hypothetical protein